MAADASPAPLARTRPFHGWRVVGAGLVAHFVATSCTFHVFGVFVVPLEEAFGATRGAISWGFGLAMLTMGLAAPLVGRAIDRGPVRGMMVTGACLLSAGLLLMSRATALWQLGVIFASLVALGAAMFGPVASMSLAANWFVRRRGLALGVTVAGATLGGFIAPPVAAWLIARLGWRGALAALGVFAAVLSIPVLLRFVVARPEDVGQLPDGDAEPADARGERGPGAGAAATPLHVPEIGELLRDRRLWLIALGFALIYTSPSVMFLHLVPFAEDLGYERQRAAFFFSCYAPFSLLGKLAFGAVADRVDARQALLLPVALLVATWGLLLTTPSYSLLLATAAVFGLGVGALGPIQGVVIGSCFGRGAFGRVLGIGSVVGLPFGVAAGPLIGMLRDATGSYQIGFGLQVGTLLLAALVLSLLRVPRS